MRRIKNMSETNKEKIPLELNELSEVSGGQMTGIIAPLREYNVGQKVRAYSYFIGEIRDAYQQNVSAPWQYDVSDGNTRQNGVYEKDLEPWYE